MKKLADVRKNLIRRNSPILSICAVFQHLSEISQAIGRHHSHQDARDRLHTYRLQGIAKEEPRSDVGGEFIKGDCRVEWLPKEMDNARGIKQRWMCSGISPSKAFPGSLNQTPQFPDLNVDRVASRHFPAKPQG